MNTSGGGGGVGVDSRESETSGGGGVDSRESATFGGGTRRRRGRRPIAVPNSHCCAKLNAVPNSHLSSYTIAWHRANRLPLHIYSPHAVHKYAHFSSKDVEPLLQDVEPLLQDVEPLLQDVEPVLQDVEPLLQDVEPPQESMTFKRHEKS